MVQFRWIKVSLFVMLLLQFTAAVTGQNQPSFTVRVGDDVTLPCENVKKDQDKCDRTTWIFSWNEGATPVELVTLGQIMKHVFVDDISDRLSVTEKCSLVITNVTVRDVGRYTCRQINKSGKQQGPDSHVHLSVVDIDKHQTDDSVLLTCAVLTYKGCGYTVKWLYDDDNNVTETIPLNCSAKMTFSLHLHQKSNNVLPKCKVTDDKSGQTLLSPVSLESSGDKTAAVTGQNQPSFTVRVGDDVTLPCENVMKDQDKCDRTTWIFSRDEGGTAVELVTLGQIRKDWMVKAKSDRLSVTEKCSLVITNVTVRDVGRYTCRQINKSGKQQGPDSHVHLSVVNIDKHQTDDSVLLTCSVLTYKGCGYTVKWLYDDDTTVTETISVSCGAMMTFSPHLHQKSNNVSLRCKVTDDKSGQTLLSHVSLESSGDKTGGNKTSPAEDDTPPQVDLWIIIVAVGLGALLIVTVAVMIWKRSKGRDTQMQGNMGQSLNPAVTPSALKTSEDMADPEDGVSYASVNFTRKTNSKARVCGDGDGDDDVDETVTYSTVKASSSSAGASADLRDLYATVNKPETNA